MEKCRKIFQRTCEWGRTTVDSGGQIKGCPLGNFALELSTQDDTVQQKLQEVFQLWTNYLERVLAQAVADGELPNVDTTATAQAIVAYFEGVFMLAKTYNDPNVIDRLAQGVVQLTLSPKL